MPAGIVATFQKKKKKRRTIGHHHRDRALMSRKLTHEIESSMKIFRCSPSTIITLIIYSLLLLFAPLGGRYVIFHLLMPFIMYEFTGKMSFCFWIVYALTAHKFESISEISELLVCQNCRQRSATLKSELPHSCRPFISLLVPRNFGRHSPPHWPCNSYFENT